MTPGVCAATTGGRGAEGGGGRRLGAVLAVAQRILTEGRGDTRGVSLTMTGGRGPEGGGRRRLDGPRFQCITTRGRGVTPGV